PESLTVCFNNPIQLNLQVSPSNCTYEWSPMEYIVSGGNTATPLINPSVNTTLFVTVTNSYQCQETASIPVTVQTGTFSGNFNAWCTHSQIYLGESTLLESTLYTDNQYNYSWTPSNHLETPHEHTTLASPVETTLFTVKVTDVFGCFKSDTVTVFVIERICDEPYVYIPNAFTPNGDGNNDVLYVRSEIMDQFVFRVYNRLGELMFETKDKSMGWDGKYKGEKCTPGVYDYYLEGRCVNMEPILKKGNVTLIR
ncbi:MAG TPA: gliding motility-associated C-terminal domain-containing protein, partial [Bacteroidales bacterium]|nr:gliding motility-associated C-terminal domain-containing protein [Bacteroidales bacterium]